MVSEERPVSYVIHIIARDAAVANQLAVALSGDPADAESFTEDNAVRLIRDGVPALGLEVQVTSEARYLAACSFRDGGNPFGLDPAQNAAKRATMDMRCGGAEILWQFRPWAASLGYSMREAGQ